jgi:hypothetical protein
MFHIELSLAHPEWPRGIGACQKVFNYVVGSSQSGVKVLQVPEFYEDCGGDRQCVSPGFCSLCVARWESRHVEVRKKAWVMLPDIFGLKG